MCQLCFWHTKRAKGPIRAIVVEWSGVRPQVHSSFIIFIMTTSVFSYDVAVGMLRRGHNGNSLLEILNVIVPEQVEITREYVCEQLGIADCPENDEEINAYLAAV